MITNNDTTTRSIEWAMDGLERRSQVISDNIANSEVPNFKASTVEFESQLRSALSADRLNGSSSSTVRNTTNGPGANGNNVRMEDELVAMIQTNLNRSAMVQSFNYKANLLRTALRGGA